ncbi:MAG: alpha/beta hydrolase [Acidimicrobiia bacterium]|nr:alpha/beta hydrolase [Acidimicrobiia bacterium]
MVPDTPTGAGVQALAIRAAVLGLRAVQLVSPVPAARLTRALFAKTGAAQAEMLAAHRPADVDARLDERYGSRPDECFDVFTPAGSAVPGPTVVWVHGGGFVGGTKDELADYFRLLASHGFTVVAVRYTLAPEATFPTPVRQTLAALGYLERHAGDLGVDPQRIVLAGDSAGSHIAAQTAMVCTDPAAATRLGLDPVAGVRLAGVVLCCGVYDVRTLVAASNTVELFVDAAMWAYSGVRHYRDDETFLSAMSVPDHLSDSFPPAFVTVGNVDPLLAQSQRLVERFEELGVPVECLLYPPDHTPALSHEYQFDLELDDARAALEAIVRFIDRTTAAPQA